MVLPPSTRIALQLPADGGFAFSDLFGNFGLRISSFQICRYLVSLFFGKLCVLPYQYSFDQDFSADNTTSAYRFPAISVALMS